MASHSKSWSHRRSIMPTFSGAESVSIPCVKCGHENPVTINQLERNPEVVCAKCGATTGFVTANLVAGMKSGDDVAK